MREPSLLLTRHDLEAKIVKRCWENDEFQKQFTADPVGTAVKYLEVPAASLPNIFVHQEALGSWHIVLPAKPSNTNELSEADLEKVAGGTASLQLISTVVTIAVIESVGSASLTASITITLDNGW
jgi:hypothetical protein